MARYESRLRRPTRGYMNRKPGGAAPKSVKPVSDPIAVQVRWDIESGAEGLRNEIVRAVRRSGMTFADISDRGGPSVATLNAWENGTTKGPRLDTAVKVLDLLGMELVVLPTSRSREH